ncbi:MAG: hypothetical protein RR342_03955 [Bacilli bacterium]
MKNKSVILCAACLLTVGITSCQSEVTKDEAYKLLNSFKPEDSIKELKTISITSELKEEGTETIKIQIDFDIASTYYYITSKSSTGPEDVELFTKVGEQYILSNSKGSTVIPSTDVLNKFNEKLDIISLSLFITTADLDGLALLCGDGKISYYKDGNNVKFEAKSKDEKIVYNYEINELGLTTKQVIKNVIDGKASEGNTSFKYNGHINKKSKL